MTRTLHSRKLRIGSHEIGPEWTREKSEASKSHPCDSNSVWQESRAQDSETRPEVAVIVVHLLSAFQGKRLFQNKKTKKSKNKFRKLQSLGAEPR